MRYTGSISWENREEIVNKCNFRYYKKYACNIKGKTISPHKLRATYGTTLYNATGDIVLVQKNLHHASINTTLLYVRGMEEKAQKESVEIMKNII